MSEYLLFYWIIPVLILTSYVGLIYTFYKGWDNIPEFIPDPDISPVFISVIIAVRNEKENILTILSDIAEQDYPSRYFEVLVVNDHSQDSSEELIIDSIATKENFVLLSLPVGKYGKKEAISLGTDNAKGVLIVTVDADCRVQKQWLSSIASFYRNSGEPDMIIGLVDFIPSGTFFGKLQNFEFLSLIGTGAGAAGARHSIMCNGANLAYKKETYQQLMDPMTKSSVSGDDVFLMLKLKQKGYAIRVIRMKQSIVYTRPASYLRGFISQRSRWISKARHYRDPDIIIAALVVFFTNSLLLYTLILLVSGMSILIFPVVFVLKSLVDLWFMNKILNYFQKRELLKFLFIAQLLYPFYMLSVSVVANIFGYKWKGRTGR